MVYLQKYRYCKYGNRASDYNGYIYDSGFEADYARELDFRLKAKDIKAWERQFKVEIWINGMWILNHKIDFRIENNDGSFELVECKGMETIDWRIRKKLLEAVWLPEHPDHTYTVVKENSSLWKKRKRK